MARKLKVGVATEETWGFLDEVYEELAAHHQASIFQRRTVNTPAFNTRLNRSLFRQDFSAFLRDNDVIFFEWASELLAAASRLPKTSAIVTRLHRYEMYRWANKINWDAVDVIILVSEAKRREFTQRFPQHASKIVVIPEAISPERFQPIYKPFSGDIGILCHLRPRKRVYELVLAYSELLRVRPYLRLHVGGGEASGFEEYAAVLTSLVERLDLQDCVTLYGHVDDPIAWYGKIDILVSNSYSEGLQVSLLEAMAMRRYCLSHHWDGAEELMPAENLHYTDRELQENILRYCDMAEGEREALQDEMRALVIERFDVNQTKAQIREVLEEAALRRSKERAGQG